MSEEIERIGPVDTPGTTAETPADPILSSPGATLSSPRMASSDDIETLGANLRNAEDMIAYLRMNEMRYDARIRDLEARMNKAVVEMDKFRFYLTICTGMVGASMILTLVSLLHTMGLL